MLKKKSIKELEEQYKKFGKRYKIGEVKKKKTLIFQGRRK